LKNKYKDLKFKTNKKSYKRFKASSNVKLKKLQQKKNELLNKENLTEQDKKEISKIEFELDKDRNYIKNILNEMKILSLKKNKKDTDLEQLSKLQKIIENTKNELEVFEIIWHFSKNNKEDKE
jgi:ribosomal protein L35